MEAIVLRGRRWLVAGVTLLLLLIATTRLAVVFLTVNGREYMPSLLVADALVVAVLLYAAFGRDRLSRWLGVLLFACLGLIALYSAAILGAVTSYIVILTPTIRVEVVYSLAGVSTKLLGLANGATWLGFAVLLAVSPAVRRYLASRRGQRAEPGAAADGGA